MTDQDRDYEALLREARDLLWYESSDHKDCPGCDLERRIDDALPGGVEGDGERRLTINPEPLKVVPAKTCIGCGKRAPWCSCGAMEYR